MAPEDSQLMEADQRPWGSYQILRDTETHKVKTILVLPGKRLSLQRHCFRSEHWYVVEGTGMVTINDDAIVLDAGQAINIPQGAWHRIANPGESNLVFIEIQTGTYFGEDDIERREDDYGRVA